MVATSAEMLQGMFPVIATTYAHLTVAQAGIAVGCGSLASLVAGPFFGWVSDRVDRHLALGVRSVANTVSSILYILFPLFGVFVAARTMDDMGKAAFRPTWGAILARVSDGDPSHRARTMTFLDSSYTLAEVIAPMLAGLLIGVFGIPAMLGARVGLSVLTEIHAVRVFRHQRSRNQDRGFLSFRSFPQRVREVAVRHLSASPHQHVDPEHVRPAEEAQA